MNINSRINWQVGLELTEQTFKGHDTAVEGRISALRSALHNGQFGLLPDSVYYNHPTFVRQNLEIPNLRFMALLRNGEIIDVDENVEVSISMLYDDCYYVVATLDRDEPIYFDHEGVPMVRPSNRFICVTPSQLAESTDLFPIARLHQVDNNFQIDTKFIPPVVMIGTSSRLMQYVKDVTENLERITTHSNLERGEATLSLNRILFEIKSLNDRSLLSGLISLMNELQQALNYYIITPNSLSTSLTDKLFDPNDIEPWLTWSIKHIEWVAAEMEHIVLEDHSIDYEKLKMELYDQLSHMLRDELYKQMYEQLSIELREEITRDVKNPLMSFINGEVRKELYADLKAQLMRDLDNKLSPELYDKLYAALYVEEEKVDDSFTPII